MSRIAKNTLTNYNWFLEYSVQGDTILIIRHWRERCVNTITHADDGAYRMYETFQRVVEKVEVAGVCYDVANPAHVFSYDGDDRSRYTK